MVSGSKKENTFSIGIKSLTSGSRAAGYLPDLFAHHYIGMAELACWQAVFWLVSAPLIFFCFFFFFFFSFFCSPFYWLCCYLTDSGLIDSKQVWNCWLKQRKRVQCKEFAGLFDESYFFGFFLHVATMLWWYSRSKVHGSTPQGITDFYISTHKTSSCSQLPIRPCQVYYVNKVWYLRATKTKLTSIFS